MMVASFESMKKKQYHNKKHFEEKEEERKMNEAQANCKTEAALCKISQQGLIDWWLKKKDWRILVFLD